MKNNLLVSLAIAASFASSAAFAGGSLETFNFTNEAFLPNTTRVEVVDQFLDKRCSSLNFTLDTVTPNAGRDNEIDIETTRAAMQVSMDQWNNIPTSYVEMNVGEVRTLNNGLRRFDFINEITFETPDGFNLLAQVVPTVLQIDINMNVGDDIDGDGDSDVFDPEELGRNTCFDADQDGDIEFPAGFYKAGTILDSDVQFGSSVTWTTTPDNTNAADLQAVATHEFGHSHGLSHSAINRISEVEGNGSTMFPFINIFEPQSQFDTRTLHEDDIAWSSYKYPEGTDSTGIAALQAGDVAFSNDYIVVEGNVTLGGLDVLGANVFAEKYNFINNRTERTTEAFSGKANLLRDANGNLQLAPPEQGIVDGRYELPLRRGNYEFGLKPLDGAPVAASRVTTTYDIGRQYGQADFAEEYASWDFAESNIEVSPGSARNIAVFSPFYTPDVNFVVNESIFLRSYPFPNFRFANFFRFQESVTHATRFANADVVARIEAGLTLTTALLRTNVIDSSIVPTYDALSIKLGRVINNGASVEFASFPLQSESPFYGVNNEDSPYFFNYAPGFTQQVLGELKRNPDMDLFVVVETTDAAPTGAFGALPLIGIDNSGQTGFGNSYTSVNGETLRQLNDLNWAIQLVFAPPVN